MVFHKKGSTPAKNFQPKKGKKQVEADDDDSDMFDDMDDSDDFEDGSDEEMPVQKTPQNKTPKGRQSLSEKKVTFDMSGKNTPGKTPNKNNQMLKKTPTPGKQKGALEEFKGIKGGKLQLQKEAVEEDDDDDDDDDDEDDSDVDLDIDEDDMDEDDEDDEEEEEDDDDDEEEEEEKPKQKQPNLKQKNNVEQNKQKTPIKNDKAKNQTPKNEAVSPKKAAKPQKNTEIQSIEVQRRKERDVKMLFVGGLPTDVNAQDLQVLSPDIQDVIIPSSNRKNHRTLFAFLCFASEAKAEANFKTLQNKKFRGQLLNIDFVGEKSKKRPLSYEPKINEKRLYISGIPLDATIAQVAVYFPKANQITFNRSPTYRSANVNFENVEDANEAFKTNKNCEIDGHKLIVMHSTSHPQKKNNRKPQKKNKKNINDKQGGNPAKKMKVSMKQDSDDEE